MTGSRRPSPMAGFYLSSRHMHETCARLMNLDIYLKKAANCASLSEKSESS